MTKLFPKKGLKFSETNSFSVLKDLPSPQSQTSQCAPLSHPLLVVAGFSVRPNGRKPQAQFCLHRRVLTRLSEGLVVPGAASRHVVPLLHSLQSSR